MADELTLEKRARALLTRTGMCVEAWSAPFAIQMYLTNRSQWKQISKLQPYATAVGQAALRDDSAMIETVLRLSDVTHVATYDDLVERVNAAIDAGVEKKEQAHIIQNLLDEMRTLIYG